MTAPRSLLLLCAAALLGGTIGLAAAPAPPPPRAAAAPRDAEEFFETRVRPLLVRRCGSCHTGGKSSGGLALASRDALLKGGGRGPALVPGKPEESLLWRLVSGADPALKMPPGGLLAADEIETVGEWIRRGAYWPAEKKTDTAAPLWSVRPVRRPPVPKVKDPRWVRNPIDAFVLRALEQRGMRPAPPAGPRELIRRVTFDLTGLPPTPEEVEAFVRESSSSSSSSSSSGGDRGRGRGRTEPPHSGAAYERLVDRLLASPRYGERWARYWLDLVRYADSNGYERDAEKPFSWKYRDYVIASLNADKPYDRFVTEQLAGDELPDRSEESVTATGFLRLGTWDDEPNDALEYQYERLDDLVHATSTAFLGLTVRCARCHDHKFDPIPQKDYYAVGAAFWAGYLQPGDGKLLGGPPPERLGYPVLGFTDRGPTAPALHLLPNGDPRRAGPVVEPGYLSLLPQVQRPAAPPVPASAATTQRRLQLARWITDPRNPLTPRVLVNRVWQHHFGQGLVRTPNNFGRKGSLPTHPELLDWLAATFVEGSGFRGQGSGAQRLGFRGQGSGAQRSGFRGQGSGAEPRGPGRSGSGRSGPEPRTLNPEPSVHAVPPEPRTLNPEPYSLKRLHRLILLSQTYRMASVHPEEARYAQQDSGNERLWRFNRRRLDADALRDSMLAVSGQLDLRVGGRGFTPVVSREALEGLSRKGAEWTVSPPEEQRRRSVYMFLKRALIMPFLTVFDFGDTTQPVEQRDSSIVAPQALALLNNSFSHEQSQALARRVRREAGPGPGRQVDRLWRLALGRSPDAEERATALRHLQRAGTARPAARPASTPSAATPAALPLPRLWLRADQGVTVDGTGRVSGWADQSGGHHAAQPEEGARPELVRDGLNGRPALRFDGKGRFLSLRGQPLTSAAFTLVAVASDRAANGSHREIFSNWRREGNIGTSVFLGTTGAGTVRFSDAFAPAGTLSNPERPLILTAVTGPSGAAVYQDRRLLADRPGPLPDRKLDSPYVIGQQGNIGGEYWNGEIAELRAYDRPLSAPELEALWNDLSARYGIAKRPEPPDPADRALASLCHVLLNTNEFLFID